MTPGRGLRQWAPPGLQAWSFQDLACSRAMATSIFQMIKPCKHPKAQTKRYVGSTETYCYCPDCMETWGGEETPAKKALIAAAAEYEDRLGGESAFL